MSRQKTSGAQRSGPASMGLALAIALSAQTRGCSQDATSAALLAESPGTRTTNSLEIEPSWTADPTDEPGAAFGFSVGTAGDVNADGYGDVIIGAPCFGNGANCGEGRVYVYHGSAFGPLHADWFANPTDQDDASFGMHVSTAGDVNGDGYDDVIIGAQWWDGEENNEGRVFVYHGSALGLPEASQPNWFADPTNQEAARFGGCVATAGDVNGDGYGDVIIGAPYWQAGPRDPQEGR
ncbi:integrin alpha, partial [Myxococcota bacterium]